jgi:uncharacterized protein YciI
MNKSAFLFIVLSFLLKSGSLFAQQSAGGKNTHYDSLLATRLGVDEYGMKEYYLVLLNRGSHKGLDSIQRLNIQEGHLKNIARLAKENKLILAGPFFGNQDLRGIFIFNASSIDEVKEWVETDPAVKAGVLKTEILPWYGSGALMMVPEIHEKIHKGSFTN